MMAVTRQPSQWYGRYMVQGRNLDMEDANGHSVTIQQDTEWMVIPNREDQDLYFLADDLGSEYPITGNALSWLVDHGYLTRCATSASPNAPRCSKCGAHADHTGWQYYPLDEQCRIL